MSGQPKKFELYSKNLGDALYVATGSNLPTITFKRGTAPGKKNLCQLMISINLKQKLLHELEKKGTLTNAQWKKEAETDASIPIGDTEDNPYYGSSEAHDSACKYGIWIIVRVSAITGFNYFVKNISGEIYANMQKITITNNLDTFSIVTIDFEGKELSNESFSAIPKLSSDNSTMRDDVCFEVKKNPYGTTNIFVGCKSDNDKIKFEYSLISGISKFCKIIGGITLDEYTLLGKNYVYSNKSSLFETIFGPVLSKSVSPNQCDNPFLVHKKIKDIFFIVSTESILKSECAMFFIVHIPCGFCEDMQRVVINSNNVQFSCTVYSADNEESKIFEKIVSLRKSKDPINEIIRTNDQRQGYNEALYHLLQMLSNGISITPELLESLKK